MAISILELMKAIRKMDMEGMFGQMDVCMKVVSPMTLSTFYFI
jgi:hypothetical protein